MLLSTAIALPGYHIAEPLYTGSRTLVYRAVRTDNQQPVVIKLLKNEYPSFSELVQFRNQYTIAKNLHIKGIVKPHSLEPYRNGYALVMEDFGGTSLRHFANERQLPLEQFWPIALQLLDTLHLLHQQRVIHKDLILANAIDALDESNIGQSFAEIKANPNQITITTSFVVDNQVSISIADNGSGMNQEVKQKIFEHLFTTKAVGKGTGLGLAIARQIVVEKHSGSITVVSQPGEGTVFKLLLPIQG